MDINDNNGVLYLKTTIVESAGVSYQEEEKIASFLC